MPIAMPRAEPALRFSPAAEHGAGLPPAPGRPPNILLVLVDDMGYGDCGAFGNPHDVTPALDAFAESGIRLTQQYAGSPVCAPSRACLLTGRYPHRTGAIDTLEGRGLDRLSADEVTLADLLKAQGYSTGLVGKWHLGALDQAYHPNARGFDAFLGFRGGWSDYWSGRVEADGTPCSLDGAYMTDVFTKAAVDFIDRHAPGPFFLHLAWNAPHFPFQAPAHLITRYREQGLGEGVARVYAMLRRMDDGFGRVLDALARNGIEDDTIVLFLSDNGPQLGDWDEGRFFSILAGAPPGDARLLHLDRFNGEWRGAKGTTYEGGIRVPAFIRWPAGLPAGSDCPALLHFSDWLPTLLAAAGAEAPRDRAIDGADALPVLRGDATSTGAGPRFWQWNRYAPVRWCNAGMRDGAWKLIRPAAPGAMAVPPEDQELDLRAKYAPETVTRIVPPPWPGPAPDAPAPPEAAPLLFNLADDPREQHDLAAVEPERTARMVAALDRWFETVDAERRAHADWPGA